MSGEQWWWILLLSCLSRRTTDHLDHTSLLISPMVFYVSLHALHTHFSPLHEDEEENLFLIKSLEWDELLETSKQKSLLSSKKDWKDAD